MSNIYKVTLVDLIGEIRKFPIEVAQKMVEYQFEQTGQCDVRIFQDDRSANKYGGGFTWDMTEEGHRFWQEIITRNKFHLFYERYAPKNLEVFTEIGYSSSVAHDKISEYSTKGHRKNSHPVPSGSIYYMSYARHNDSKIRFLIAGHPLIKEIKATLTEIK